jgi:uncharacterized membrane protein
VSEKTGFEKFYAAFFRNEFPADLTIVVVWLAASIVTIYFPILNETTLKVVLALPVVLFIPGYCLVAALFPKKNDISLIERIALSFGLSIAVVSLIGLGLNFTLLGIRLDSVVIALTMFIWVLVLIAHYRRAILPFEERFGVPFFEIAGTLRNAVLPKEGRRVDRLLTVVLTLLILASILIIVYVIVVPKEGERFTEFFILGENKTAADYPEMILPAENYPMYIGIENHEYRNITYTIETWGMIMEFDSMTNTSRIMAIDPLWQHSLTLTNNETTNIPYNLSVGKTGYNRVEFLLFNESVPGPEVSGWDRINASYHDLHLWVTDQ